MKFSIKQNKRNRRHKRIKAKIFGTNKRPRFCVFRSNKHIYVQLIDDAKAQVLAAANDLELKNKKTKKEKAYLVGKLIAEKATKKKIEKVVFDRGGYKYHGRVEALAKGSREGGLKF